VRTGQRWAVIAVVALALMATAACGGASRRSAAPTTTFTTIDPAVVAGQDLSSLILEAPVGFMVDPTPGATGAITPDLFGEYGGLSSASQAGFVAGYKQGYADQTAPDGLAITLLKFATTPDARTYFQQTAPKTLALAAARIKPFALIPGAISVTGTKLYQGEYAQGVVFNRGVYYVSVIYVNTYAGTAPGELTLWAKDQYLQL
jgi:hypothetical protein